MDREFHYEITALVAYSAGFSKEEAAVIANSSQYVDDNDMIVNVNDSTGGSYRSVISQTFDIVLPQWKLQEIFPVFHFIPGVPGGRVKRKDGRTHPLCTSPDSPLAQKILKEAFKSPADTRLYRIGVASHSYVDSWAHQGYVGGWDNFNRVGGVFPLPVGHANKGMEPDRFGEVWEDERLVHPRVDNGIRFVKAAKRLYEHYRSYLSRQDKRNAHFAWCIIEAVIREIALNAAPGASGMLSRIAAYKRLMPWLPEYSAWTWFNEAVTPEAGGLISSWFYTFFSRGIKFNWKVDREKTHWFKFQEAVKEHQRLVLPMIKPLLQ